MPKTKPKIVEPMNPTTHQIVSVERMGELVGSDIEIETQNGKTYAGKLVKAPVIDKVFFASIEGEDGLVTNVNTAFIGAFRVTNLAKPKVLDVRDNLPCKGEKNLAPCKFPAQNFEPFCAGCPGKQKRVDPLKLGDADTLAGQNPEDEEKDDDEDGEE